VGAKPRSLFAALAEAKGRAPLPCGCPPSFAARRRARQGQHGGSPASCRHIA